MLCFRHFLLWRAYLWVLQKPKGLCYTHSLFRAVVLLLKRIVLIFQGKMGEEYLLFICLNIRYFTDHQLSWSKLAYFMNSYDSPSASVTWYAFKTVLSVHVELMKEFIRFPTKSNLTWSHFIVGGNVRIDFLACTLQKNVLFSWHSPQE